MVGIMVRQTKVDYYLAENISTVPVGCMFKAVEDNSLWIHLGQDWKHLDGAPHQMVPAVGGRSRQINVLLQCSGGVGGDECALGANPGKVEVYLHIYDIL